MESECEKRWESVEKRGERDVGEAAPVQILTKVSEMFGGSCGRVLDG